MDEQENNVCAICGGARRVNWTISFEECRPVEMRFDPASLADNGRLCAGHPEPAQRHDGRLDEDYQVCHGNGAWGFEVVVLEYKGTTQALIRPDAALSLLAWLQQEREALQRLAKEQESVLRNSDTKEQGE